MATKIRSQKVCLDGTLRQMLIQAQLQEAQEEFSGIKVFAFTNYIMPFKWDDRYYGK